jgi:hypothetical protein
MADEIHTLETNMFEKVDELLADTGKISIQTSLRLSLQLQRTTAEALNSLVNHIKIQNGRIGKLEKEVTDLRNKNIINWITANPKSAIMWFVVTFFSLEALAHEFTTSENIAFVLGVLRKWAGL